MNFGRFSKSRQNVYAAAAGLFTVTACSTFVPCPPAMAAFGAVASEVLTPAASYTGQ